MKVTIKKGFESELRKANYPDEAEFLLNIKKEKRNKADSSMYKKEIRRSTEK